jgi:hypothetical protein
MSAEFARGLEATRNDERTTVRTLRMHLVLSLGPLTSLAGIGWALAQPWRLTLLHPHGQGFWWLFTEPPLYVVLVGVLFRVFVARGLVEDMEEEAR